MAAGDLGDRRAGALGHEALGWRWNHFVLAGHEVPARLGLPSRPADCAGERPDAPWNLRVRHERRLLSGYIGRERRSELRFVEKQIAVLRRQYRRRWRAGRRVFDERRYRLAIIQRE